MNTSETNYTYAGDSFKYQNYTDPADRAQAFGYNYMRQGPLQNAYHQQYFCNTTPPKSDVINAPKDYYNHLKLDHEAQAIIGPLDIRPNLYNDNVHPYTTTSERPNLYKSWQPFTTTATSMAKSQGIMWIPHKQPCEVASRSNPNYWQADLNARIFERGLVSAAAEQPYSNHWRRVAMQNLVSLNMRADGDPYSKPVEKPSDSFCHQLKENCTPPATTSF